MYVGAKLLYKHDEIAHEFPTQRFPPPSPNDLGERNVGEVQQDDLAFRVNTLI